MRGFIHVYTVTLQMEDGPFVVPSITAISEDWAVATACEIAQSMHQDPHKLRGVSIQEDEARYRLH